MAFIDFEGGVFSFNDGSSLQDLSSEIISIEGLPGSFDERERTSMADTAGRKFAYGLQNTTFTVEFMASDGANDALAVLSSAWAAKATRAFERGPAGSGSGALKFSGSALVLSVTESGRVNDTLTYRATLRVDGAVTKGTYSS